MTMPSDQPSAMTGQRVGSFEILEKLGRGGMGEVWKARDLRLHRDVAIKVVRNDAPINRDTKADARLWQEARASAQVSHPNLCQLFDVIDDGAHVYLVMELLQGQPLSARIAGTPMLPCEAQAIMGAVLDALKALHDHRLVHCDLKPSNVFLTCSGVKVLDFGLAARHKCDESTLLLDEQTRTETVGRAGMIAGTPAYMAPERIAGAPPAPPADLFAAGCMLHEMLTGKKAFNGDTLSDVLQRIMHGGPAQADLPAESQRFWPVISKALAKRPEERFASAAEMRESLDDSASQPLIAPSPPRPVPRMLRATAAVMAVALVAGGTWVASRRGVFAHSIAATENDNSRSIAILPIANRTGDSSLDYIADGTTSNIIRQLSQLPGLKVISKNSVQRFAATYDPRKAAAELGVGHVLTGSIHREGNGNFNMDFELSRGSDGSILLGRQYRPDSADLLGTQAIVVTDIVKSLAMSLTKADQKTLGARPTLNNEAWDSYLRGAHLADLMDPISLSASLPLFQKAIEKDPSFALAMSDYAASHMKLGIFYDDPRKHMPLAKQFAVQALSIDDSFADAHGVLGLIALLYDWDYGEAQRQLLLASGRMNQGALSNLSCSTHLLASTGRGPRAEMELQSALLSDPLSVTLQSELGCNSYYSRQYDRAIREFQKALLLRPNDPSSLWGLGRAYGQKKMFDDAEASLKMAKLPNGSFPPPILGELGYVYGYSGRKAEAHEMIRHMDELRTKMFIDPFLEAVIYLSMGEMNETYARLDDAYKVRSAFLVSIKSDPKWDRVHDDPRYRAMLQRIGFGD